MVKRWTTNCLLCSLGGRCTIISLNKSWITFLSESHFINITTDSFISACIVYIRLQQIVLDFSTTEFRSIVWKSCNQGTPDTSERVNETKAVNVKCQSIVCSFSFSSQRYKDPNQSMLTLFTFFVWMLHCYNLYFSTHLYFYRLLIKFGAR